MKKKFTKHILAIAVIATAIVGVQGYTPKAEECVEELNVEENESSGRDVPYYNISINGGSWDGNYYVVNGTTISDAFFCDGTYTYYLQYDGTPMKNRLTYHPDGEHVIYFDENGREVFSDFAMVKQSISGEAVDDMCFFDVYGYMYVNQLTYDNTGTKIYYVNEYGVIERNGWFEYSDYIKYFDSYKTIGDYRYGYANADGTLMTSQFTYNWNDKVVYLCGDGITIDEGVYNIDGTSYLFDVTGELIEQYSQPQSTYTLTTCDADGNYIVYVYEGVFNQLLTCDIYKDGVNISHEEYTYDSNGNKLSRKKTKSDGSVFTDEYTYNSVGQKIFEKCVGDGYNIYGDHFYYRYEFNFLYSESGNTSYSDFISYNEDGNCTSYCEYYYSDEGEITGYNSTDYTQAGVKVLETSGLYHESRPYYEVHNYYDEEGRLYYTEAGYYKYMDDSTSQFMLSLQIVYDVETGEELNHITYEQ